MSKLKWIVLHNNFNRKTIEHYNVFEHSSFASDVCNLLKTIDNKEEFAKQLERKALYYFWSKAEMELVVASWPTYITIDELERALKDKKHYEINYNKTPNVLNISPSVYKKIDIYEQLMLNWDCFVNYIWENRNEM